MMQHPLSCRPKGRFTIFGAALAALLVAGLSGAGPAEAAMQPATVRPVAAASAAVPAAFHSPAATRGIERAAFLVEHAGRLGAAGRLTLAADTEASAQAGDADNGDAAVANPDLLQRLGLTPNSALAIFVLAAVLLALLAVWNGFLARDPVIDRIRALEERRSRHKSENRTLRRSSGRGELRESSLSFMRRIVTRFNLMKGKQLEIITLKLSRCGWRSKDALVVYMFARAAMPIAFGGIVLLLLGLDSASLGPMVRFVVIGIAGILGLYGTDLYVKNVGDKRVAKMRKGLPDALDLLVICAEAGLSLDAALTRVGRELATAWPDLADEIALTALELGFLPDRQVALMNLVNRTDMPELRSLVNSLQQSERYGTSLTQSLRVLSAEYRDERMMRAEEKAARLPAIMTVPMITFILPALFIVLGGPAILRVLDTLSKL